MQFEPRRLDKNEAESWERISLLKWWPPENRNENNSWKGLLKKISREVFDQKWPMSSKEMKWMASWNRKHTWRIGTKAESTNLKRTEQRFRGKTLLRSSNAENDDEEHHEELMRHSGTIKREDWTQNDKEFESDLREGIWLMESICYPEVWRKNGLWYSWEDLGTRAWRKQELIIQKPGWKDALNNYLASGKT